MFFIYSPYAPAILVSGMYPRKMKAYVTQNKFVCQRMRVGGKTGINNEYEAYFFRVCKFSGIKELLWIHTF
jgi:hypothetical protein